MYVIDTFVIDIIVRNPYIFFMPAIDFDVRITPPTSLRSPLTEALREASVAYAEASHDHFEGVTPGLLAIDDVMLSALAEKIAKLAKSLADTPRACHFVDSRPDQAEMIEYLCEIAIDALGAAAGRLVRAHARIFVAG